MTDIPADVWEKAAAIADGWSSNHDEFTDLSADIIRAILAERERCAEIAVSFADGADVAAFRTNDATAVAELRAAERASNRIADAIRASS